MKVRYPKLPGIYKFTNKVNGKIYIGKSVCLSKRLSDYKDEIKNSKTTRRFVSSLRKNGIDNFKIEILEAFPNRNSFIEGYILQREEFWIKFYNSTNPNIGYNEYSKDTLLGYERIDTVIKKIRESKLKDKNPMFGIASSRRIKICQIDIETFKTLKVYDMIIDVTKESKRFSIPKVSLVINGKRKTHAGFLWEKFIENETESEAIDRRKSEYNTKKKKIIKPFSDERKLQMSLSRKGKPLLYLRKQIKQIDPITMEEVKIWSSVSDAESFFNQGRKSHRIRNHIRGLTKLAYSFKWEYV